MYHSVEPEASPVLRRDPYERGHEDQGRYKEEIQTLQEAETSIVHEDNISRPEQHKEDQEGFCFLEETNPNPGSRKGEQGKARSCAQGEEKASEKGRPPFLKTGHDLLVGYGEISSIF